MKSISNARTISDIEFVVDAMSLADNRTSWSAYGVSCIRDRHRFSGQAYTFLIEVLQLERMNGQQASWHLIIITERWHSRDSDASLRGTKWLKILDGKASDVLAWMRRSRDLKLREASLLARRDSVLDPTSLPGSEHG